MTEKRRSTTFVTSRGAIINVAAPSVYIAPGVTPADVTSPAELREELRKVLPNKTLSLEAGEACAHGSCLVGDYFYATLVDYANPNTVNGKLAKIDIRDLSRVDVISLPRPYPVDVVTDGSYLYIGYNNTADYIITKVNLATFTVVANLSIPGLAWNAVVDKPAEYLYAGSYEPSINIFKVRLSDFTHVATLTLGAGESYCHGLEVDWEYLYVACSVSPGRVVRVRLSDFTRVDAVTFEAGEDNTLDIVQLEGYQAGDGYLYALTLSNPAYLVRIRRGDFAKQDSLQMWLGGKPFKMNTDGEFMYVGVDSVEPINVGVVRLSDFKLVSIIKEPVPSKLGLSGGVCSKPQSDGDFLYFASYTNPAVFWKRRLERVYASKPIIYKLWENEAIPAAGGETKAFPMEAEGRKTVWIRSDQPGTLYLRAFNEQSKTFQDVAGATLSVSANALTNYNIVDTRAKSVKLFFDPVADATVSAWAVI